MFTGQISSQALHDVHDQISSAVMRSNTELTLTVISLSTPMGGETRPPGAWAAVAAMTSPLFSTISRGSSGLPVALAGHTLVQRPHMVHESRSSSCFHVKLSTVFTPNDSSDVSARFGMARIAPFGRSRSRRYMLSGDVKMWRSIVMGSRARNAMKVRT